MEDETLEIEVDISRAVFQKVKRSPIDATTFVPCELNPRGDIAIFLKHIFGETIPFRDAQSSAHSLTRETKTEARDHRPYYREDRNSLGYRDEDYLDGLDEVSLSDLSERERDYLLRNQNSAKMCPLCHIQASECTFKGQSQVTKTPSANEEIKLRFTSDFGDLEITYEKRLKTHETYPTYQTHPPAETEDINARNIIKISGRRTAMSLIINHPKFQEAVQILKVRDPTKQDGLIVYDPITLPPRLLPSRPINRVGNNRLGTVSWPPEAIPKETALKPGLRHRQRT